MCNVYSQPPIDVFEDYIRRHRGQMPLPGWPLPNPDKRHVGPFETGNFLTAAADGQLVTHTGQWGMIRPGQKSRIEYRELPAKKPGAEPKKVPMLKNNARLERVASSPAFRDAWKNARRCLIPAEWLQEPNWETGRCIWWKLRRADRMPWMVAGIWSEWTDPESGEIVPNYAMITLNVNGHPLLNRLHKPRSIR